MKKSLNDILPDTILNWVGGEELPAIQKETFDKLSPHSGKVIFKVARSREQDIDKAVNCARTAQEKWAKIPAVQRGHLIHQICNALEKHQSEIADIVALETGKSFNEALGETKGAIALGRFYAGEGQRLYGRTTTSGTANKYALTIRQPCGIAGLIVAANTPIANVAWKVFPALICGNGVVLKSPEDTPATAWIFSKIVHEVGIIPGIFNVIHGFGLEAGAPLVTNKKVDVISFTGSTAVGKWIAEVAGKRLAKVSLELGGKNPLIVCDDADMDNAVKWTCLSAFSNAGQRCASCSRIIVFDSIYNDFKNRLIEATKSLKIGPSNEDDLGPVINERQINNMLEYLNNAVRSGAKIICGGKRLTDPEHINGFYMAPTILEDVDPNADIARHELFGPITILFKANNFDDAINLANDSPYGLTASIHTRNYHRALQFIHSISCGVAVVNAGTYGSEPHMPFGGLRQSGNGTREPGTEALDIYSELKDVYMVVDPNQV